MLRVIWIVNIFIEPTNMLDLRAIVWLENYLQVGHLFELHWLCVCVVCVYECVCKLHFEMLFVVEVFRLS